MKQENRQLKSQSLPPLSRSRPNSSLSQATTSSHTHSIHSSSSQSLVDAPTALPIISPHPTNEENPSESQVVAVSNMVAAALERRRKMRDEVNKKHQGKDNNNKKRA